MTVLEYQATSFVSYTNTGNGDGFFNVEISVPDLSAYTILGAEWYIRMEASGVGDGPNTGQVDIMGDLVIPDLSASLTGVGTVSSVIFGLLMTATVTISGGSFTGSKVWTIYPNSAPFQLFYRVTVEDAPLTTNSVFWLDPVSGQYASNGPFEQNFLKITCPGLMWTYAHVGSPYIMQAILWFGANATYYPLRLNHRDDGDGATETHSRIEANRHQYSSDQSNRITARGPGSYM